MFSNVVRIHFELTRNVGKVSIMENVNVDPFSNVLKGMCCRKLKIFVEQSLAQWNFKLVFEAFDVLKLANSHFIMKNITIF